MPKKICHICTVDMSVGILLKNQLRYFLDQGLETHAMASPGLYQAEVEAAGIRYHAVPMTRTISPLDDLVALAQMVPILRRERFDLIHLHTPKAELLGTLAGVLAGVPRIYRTIHGFYFTKDSSPLKRHAFVNIERAISRFHHKVFSQNSEDILTAEAEGIRAAADIAYLGNGIELARFDPARWEPATVAQARARWGLAAGERAIGFVGRLVQEKGLIELFEAFRALAPSRPWLKLLLVGEADLAKPDAVRVEEHLPPELLARVIQAGWQKQVEDFYPLMDLFTLPSHREGFPRTLMEACAMGLPVVATDIRGCREAVTHDDNGLLVPARAPQDLARALAAILDDPALAARLAASARQRAAREFDEREKFKLIYAAYARDLGLRAPS